MVQCRSFICVGRQDLQGATRRGTLDVVPFVVGLRGWGVGGRWRSCLCPYDHSSTKCTEENEAKHGLFTGS